MPAPGKSLFPFQAKSSSSTPASTRGFICKLRAGLILFLVAPFSFCSPGVKSQHWFKSTKHMEQMLLSTLELKDCPAWYHTPEVLSWTPALLGFLRVGKQNYFYKKLQNPKALPRMQQSSLAQEQPVFLSML